MNFVCPKCHHEQTCPCPSCQKRNPTEKPWVWTSGYTLACGGCGLEESEDWWFEQEVAQYDKWKAAALNE